MVSADTVADPELTAVPTTAAYTATRPDAVPELVEPHTAEAYEMSSAVAVAVLDVVPVADPSTGPDGEVTTPAAVAAEVDDPAADAAWWTIADADATACDTALDSACCRTTPSAVAEEEATAEVCACWITRPGADAVLVPVPDADARWITIPDEDADEDADAVPAASWVACPVAVAVLAPDAVAEPAMF